MPGMLNILQGTGQSPARMHYLAPHVSSAQGSKWYRDKWLSFQFVVTQLLHGDNAGKVDYLSHGLAKALKLTVGFSASVRKVGQSKKKGMTLEFFVQHPEELVCICVQQLDGLLNTLYQLSDVFPLLSKKFWTQSPHRCS